MLNKRQKTQAQIIEMLNEIGPSIESLSNKMDSLKEHHQKNIVDVQNDLAELELEKSKLQDSVSKLNRDEGALVQKLAALKIWRNGLQTKQSFRWKNCQKTLKRIFFFENRVMKAGVTRI